VVPASGADISAAACAAGLDGAGLVVDGRGIGMWGGVVVEDEVTRCREASSSRVRSGAGAE
jgi:hypothetical protein